MKLNRLLLCLSLVALVGCAPSNSDNNNPNPNPGGGEGGGEVLPPAVAEEFNVKLVNSVEGVNLSSDKAKAKEGSIVTITVTINDPSYKVTKVLADGVECTKLGENKYSFVMPNHPVKVTYLVFVDGDVTLQGGLSASFEREGDIYAARNIEVPNETKFDVVVKDPNGKSKKLGIRDFDRFKSFADIGFTTGENGLTIAGGATYDFFYDPSNINLPLSVVRTNVNALPNSVSSLSTLFDGSIGSASSVNPLDLTGVTYSNKACNETLTWDSYSNNVAYGKVTELDENGNSKDKAVIYSDIKDDVLTVVDTYIPGANKKHKSNYELRQDIDMYSGVYKISDVNKNGLATELNNFNYLRNYQSSVVANSLLTVAPITLKAFEADIMYSYRVGLEVGDNVHHAARDIKSVPNENGFETTIVSNKTVTINDGNSNSDNKEHYEYRVKLNFDKAGKLLNARYEEKEFNEGLYDFSNETWKIGDVNSNYEKGETKNIITAEYRYGDKKESKVNFDTTPYIVQEIKNVKVNNPNCGKNEGDNKINVGEKANDYLSFDTIPTNALNARQYKVIESDNDKVINSKDEFKGASEGDANVVVGIENGLGVRETVKVNVSYSFQVRNIVFDSTGNKYSPTINTTTANIYTGAISKFGLLIYKTQGNTYLNVPMPNDATIEYVGENYGINVTLDIDKRELIVDATNATQITGDVKVKINTSFYDSYWVEKPIEFTFHILPGATLDTFVGKWNAIDDSYHGYSINLSKDKWDPSTPGYDERRPYQGSIFAGENSYQFAYNYDSSKNTFVAEVVGLDSISSYLYLDYDIASESLGVALKVNSVDGDATKQENILGFQGGDDLEYTYFKKA